MQRALSLICAIGGLAFIAWLTWFKVVDTDIWWHIKAGQLILTDGIPALDPFAYTREGLPYIATHEWLTQIFFAVIYNVGGANGIIILRMLCAVTLFGMLVMIDRKRIWPNILLCIFATIVVRQGLTERPQMLSNICFAFLLIAVFHLIDEKRDAKNHWLTNAIVPLTLLQILWVNLHGGEALLSLGVIAAATIDEWRNKRDTKRWMLLGLCLTIALFLTPNGLHTISYVWLLFTDNTSAFIQEWHPHPWPQYLLQLGIFWIIALASIATGKRHIVFSLLTLFLFGALSRFASRHEVLFVITALALTFWQLQGSPAWLALREGMLRRWYFALPATVAVVALLWKINAPYHAFLEQKNLTGFGAIEQAKAASDFLKTNHITGKIFNSYSLGGELLFEDWNVFVDGRNVDYGYDFLKQALDARFDRTTFDALQKKYDFTIAFIDVGTENADPFPFAFLETHPDWSLLFIDDWTAVYLKRSAYPFLVEQFPLSPQRLSTFTQQETLTASNASALLNALSSAASHDDRGMRTLTNWAKTERALGNFTDAQAHAEEAHTRSPHRHEPLEVLASLAAQRGEYLAAAKMLEEVISLTKYLNVDHNYSVIADFYEKGGDSASAEKYRRK